MNNVRSQLLSIRAQASQTVLLIDGLLRSFEGPKEFPLVEGECPDDPLAYRGDRNPNAQLSDLGRTVMEKMFEAGFPVDLIAERMKVAPLGVRERRRKWLTTVKPD